MSNSREKKIIKALSLRYPNSLKVIPHEVIPLSDNFEKELLFDLGKLPKKYRNRIINVLKWYRNWPDYLRAVAFGIYKVNIYGHKISLPTVQERENARLILKDMKVWSKRCEKLFKVNLGRKEASNR